MTAYIPGNPLLYWSGKLLGNGGAIGLGYTIGTNAPIGYIVLGVACWLVGGLLSSINVQAGASFVYDPSLTVHADVNQAGTLRIATENKISNMATLTLGGAIDLTAIGRDVHSVSTKLSISA